MIFFFQFVCMVDYVDGCSYIKLSLHLWDETYLNLMADVFDVFLDSICKYLLSIFASMFIREISLPFLCESL